MNNLFLMMLKTIREQEEVILYDNIFQVSESEQHQVIEYLREVYHQESLEYPHQAPPFEPSAGLWAAQILYVAAQLVLYRKNNTADLLSLLPDFMGSKTPSSILSVDLSLRFLPDIIHQLDAMNPDDELIPILEKHLSKWHYSGIAYSMTVDKLDCSIEIEDYCVRQLYANRIIEYKRTPLAEHPAFAEIVRASLGNYQNIFWKDK
jgi:hypothetical protein